ncbi:PCNA-associated factor [Harpegnathos saltator]|uniref:PCNA-associated factor histone-like domain-containing protein n=1 Tax=Harpegnathos saltator TaxID=610380 RepID=E2BV21_HARSA|nr:PCNA-associated factor [Harpegnathos saltator]EFN80452.1 hypothetical protein EAI_02803 [Harpegnathos saltator]
MVRTRADRVPRRAVGEKSSAKKNVAVKINTPKKNGRGRKKYTSGNPYHPRETPQWQKSITCFMNSPGTTAEATADEASSKEDNNPDIKEDIEDEDEDDETD